MDEVSAQLDTADIFITYAWTSDQHREWVRLLAAHLLLLGYTVLIDEKVDYGASLNGFMREAVNARHVLMIADDNYVLRADTLPDSGVGIENAWLRRAHPDKPADWLSVLFVRNPELLLPAWLANSKSKGFDFNAHPDADDFPGSEQINVLWRWLEGLPPGRTHAVSLASLRRRAARIERIEIARDPASWANPKLSGRVRFAYGDQPGSRFTLGQGEYQFVLQVSSGSIDMIYVVSDPIKAVGLVTEDDPGLTDLGKFLTPGRIVRPRVGQSVVLMNSNGNLCLVTIEAIQVEVNGTEFVPAHIVFSYRVIVDSEEEAGAHEALGGGC